MARDDHETLRARLFRGGFFRNAARGSGQPARPNGGRWLALVPVTVCVLFFALLVPRAAPADAVPVPAVDEREVEAVRGRDRALAAKARSERLATDVLAVGSALRALHERDAEAVDGATAEETHGLYRALSFAAVGVLGRPDGARDLVALRALQLESFLTELGRREGTGESSAELVALSGTFTARMRDAGWATDRRILLDEDERRVVFKTMWNALVAVQATELALTLDEQRVLYRLYLTRPHAPEGKRRELDAERSAARTTADCERVVFNETRAKELWRADKIKRFTQVDPSYPAMYALGVAYLRAGENDLASAAFRHAVEDHPDGPFALRARNHLAMAIRADIAP